MTVALEQPTSGRGGGDGGLVARRAVIRWGWRLFRREWRQQFLILALVVVAVAATTAGAAVATNSPAPTGAGFGTAGFAASYPGSDPHLASDLASLQHQVGRVDVIENQTLPIPGSTNSYDLRAQNPQGAFGQPMLSLVSGHYPTGPGEVAVTGDVASAFHLAIGDTWQQGGTSRRVVGIVVNPQSLLDEFALVVPGQVRSPTQVTALFDAPPGSSVLQQSNVVPAGGPSGAFNPSTIVLALATVGMLLIALVAVGGFTVLAHRRLRAIGMLGAVGATDRNIRLVVCANGLAVGVIGSLLGVALGLGAWLIYRPILETSSHHLIGIFEVPWGVIAGGAALAVVATFLAALRPARAITKIPTVVALSGRPAPPKPAHRSAIPGILAIVVAAILFASSGRSQGGGGGGGLELVVAFVVLTVGVILLAPLALTAVAAISARAPIASRLALRDMARYRSRSGSALSAISLSVLIAVVICVVASARYSNVLDYAGPNLTSNQLVVYPPPSPTNGVFVGPKGSGPASTTTSSSTPAEQQASVRQIASAVGATSTAELDQTDATLQHAGPGRNFNGQIYVATPALLRALGIDPSSIEPSADVITVRPGLASVSDMQLVYGNSFNNQGPPGPNESSNSFSCPSGSCLANPVIQSVSALPSGTSAPNILFTEHAVHRLGLQTSLAGWFIQTAHPLTSGQIDDARHAAASTGMSIETKSSAPSSSQVLDYATAAGILLAIGIIAMSVGLIRSETASDLRTLTATGASNRTRRSITGVTAGTLAVLGAVVGTVAGYVAAIAYFSSAPNGDSLSELGSVPFRNLALILIGLPLLAAVGGWLFSGRDPALVAQRPLE